MVFNVYLQNVNSVYVDLVPKIRPWAMNSSKRGWVDIFSRVVKPTSHADSLALAVYVLMQ